MTTTTERTIHVIGIGAGDPEHLTLQAIAAMNAVDVFFTIDKGIPDLAGLRAEMLAKHVTRPHRVVVAPEVPRDRNPSGYAHTVSSWWGAREQLYASLIEQELPENGVGGLLVWGDPALYDATLHLLSSIARRTPLRIVSTPGISSVQALAAAHGIVLNRLGSPFLVTTGRRLADGGMPADVDDVVVMLDGRTAFAGLPDTDLDLYWGAYLGTPDETLRRGDLQTIAPDVVATRAALRERKGWIMDTYLLRRRLGN